jgi:hypothetical protein
MVDQNIASYPLSSPPPPALQSTSVHQSIKLFLLNVLIVGFIAFMFAFVLNYFNLIPFKVISIIRHNDKPVQNKDATIYLPIDLNNPDLREFAVSYNFDATVTALNYSDNQVEILTNLNSPHIPRFLVSSNTKLYYGTSPLETYGSPSVTDIKPGDQINLIALYFFKRNFWRLGYIFVPPVGSVQIQQPQPISI